jgi:hypothetical protein
MNNLYRRAIATWMMSGSLIACSGGSAADQDTAEQEQGATVAPNDSAPSQCPRGKGKDFRRAYLMDKSFAGVNLANADFSGASLINVDFTGANLTCAKFAGAEITIAIFTKAKLS